MYPESHIKLPFGDLGIIVMDNCRDLGVRINDMLIQRRIAKSNKPGREYYRESIRSDYLIDTSVPRFSNGEAKAVVNQSVRGKDIFILSDVTNYSCTYNMFGMQVPMGPDEHFQDIKRVIAALSGKVRRITVITPYLYEGRQHRRKYRESLDCALALQELEDLGVSNLITFDAHDPNVQNAVPLVGFQNVFPTYDILKTMLAKETVESGLVVDKNNLVCISPDSGAVDRAIYFASVMGVEVGMFYKRRDYSRVVNGKNPIIQHEYLGTNVEDKDCIIVDDIAASGESLLEVARELRKRGARNIYGIVTFALMTEGIEHFNKAFEEGLITRIYSTNLCYISPALMQAPWYCPVDMAEFISILIDKLNYDDSLHFLLHGGSKTKAMIKSLPVGDRDEDGDGEESEM